MRRLLNTLFVLSENAYLSLDGENVVVSQDRQETARTPAQRCTHLHRHTLASGAAAEQMGNPGGQKNHGDQPPRDGLPFIVGSIHHQTHTPARPAAPAPVAPGNGRTCQRQKGQPPVGMCVPHCTQNQQSPTKHRSQCTGRHAHHCRDRTQCQQPQRLFSVFFHWFLLAEASSAHKKGLTAP